MNKTIFSKVFSHEIIIPFSSWTTGFLIALVFWMGACSRQVSNLPIIAKINGVPVYLNELEMLGRLAASEGGLNFDSPEGQLHYRKIASNLYKTLIDIYVMKYMAEKEGLLPTPEEIETEFARFAGNLKNQGIYEEFLKRVAIDEQQLRDTLKDRLAIQKIQKKKLVDQEVEVSDQDIRDLYHQNLSQFRYPNLIRVSDIFIKSASSEGSEKREQARIRAEQMRKMIGDDPNKTFVGLAREHSDDAVTAARGGDVGFIYPKSNLKPDFEKAAFSLKEGEVSGVVETEDGFHIIWATDYEESLEEALTRVKEMTVQKKKAELYAQWLNEAAKQLNVIKLFDPVNFRVLSEIEATPSADPEKSS